MFSSSGWHSVRGSGSMPPGKFSKIGTLRLNLATFFFKKWYQLPETMSYFA